MNAPLTPVRRTLTDPRSSGSPAAPGGRGVLNDSRSTGSRPRGA
jgi:hypothetical protein